MRPYLDLTKPRITWLILMSTAIGYFFGLHDNFNWVTLIHMLLGTALIASGTAALNQWYERDADARMDRTKGRPIPAGLITAPKAFWFGVALSVLGFVELSWGVNLLTGLLGLFTLMSYLFVYTPLKRVSPHSTTIGAIPGAMPPLIGFAAAAGTLTAEAWVLFAILFFWQFPHFYAIAWMYREDYARAGIRMLPVVEPDGESTARQMLWFTLLLIPVSFLPVTLSMAGKLYLAAAVILGTWYLSATLRIIRNRTRVNAKKVLLASVAYLPLLYVAMIGGCTQVPTKELPDYYAVPDFGLIQQDGQGFSSNSLHGKVWVADFIFTTCPGPCPRLTTQMSELQKKNPDVQLVTFTVDPETDTPAVLDEYGKRYHADYSRWTFLTGPEATLKNVREESMKQGEMGSPANHSLRLILVDQSMRIRGFYDSTEEGILDKLTADIKLLQKK